MQGVSIRTFLCALFALAVLFSPAVTTAAAAANAVPDHQMQMMEAGHCTSAPSSDHQKSDGKTCCVSISLGLEIAPATPMSETAQPPSLPVITVATLRLSHLGEIATPPPRHA